MYKNAIGIRISSNTALWKWKLANAESKWYRQNRANLMRASAAAQIAYKIEEKFLDHFRKGMDTIKRSSDTKLKRARQFVNRANKITSRSETASKSRAFFHWKQDNTIHFKNAIQQFRNAQMQKMRDAIALWKMKTQLANNMHRARSA